MPYSRARTGRFRRALSLTLYWYLWWKCLTKAPRTRSDPQSLKKWNNTSTRNSIKRYARTVFLPLSFVTRLLNNWQKLENHRGKRERFKSGTTLSSVRHQTMTWELTHLEAISVNLKLNGSGHQIYGWKIGTYRPVRKRKYSLTVQSVKMICFQKH